ncbi:hypothetical protein [Sphingopyxis fribergensis]
MIEWLIEPRHAALINWIGFFVGLIGTGLGLLGLAIALRQLKAIKTETEASRDAIEAVQLKVASFDTAQECQKADRIISEIRSFLNKSEWLEIVKCYENLIHSFLRLSHSHSKIEDGDRDLLRKHTSDMAKMCDAIRKNVSQGILDFSLRGQDRALRDFSDIIVKISFSATRNLQK